MSEQRETPGRPKGHTALPWELADNDESPFITIYANGDEIAIADVILEDVSLEEARENAALIVQCVNDYPRLVHLLAALTVERKTGRRVLTDAEDAALTEMFALAIEG